MRWLQESMRLPDALCLIWPDKKPLVVGCYRRKCPISYDRWSQKFLGTLVVKGSGLSCTASAERIEDALEWAVRLTARVPSSMKVECVGFNMMHVYCSTARDMLGECSVFKSSFGERAARGNVVATGAYNGTDDYIRDRLSVDALDAFVYHVDGVA